MIDKIDGCKNNPEKSLPQKKANIPSGFTISTICLFRSMENKHKVNIASKKFCEFLKKHAIKMMLKRKE